MDVVTKVGLALIEHDSLLLCRKRSLGLLILPGGKMEPGEEPLDCLRRELHEELGQVELMNPRYLGPYRDTMAGDTSKTIEVLLYVGGVSGTPVASSEIAELVWFGRESDRSQLAPSITNKILPDLIRRGLLPWENYESN